MRRRIALWAVVLSLLDVYSLPTEPVYHRKADRTDKNNAGMR